jgi:HSP20 family protein
MTMAVRSMWDPFTALVRQMDSEFDNLSRRAFGSSAARPAYVPAADVVREGRDVVVTLELPGVDVDKDVSVEIADGRLVISGARTEHTEAEQGGWLVRETRSGEFRREFTLPEHVTADSIEAEYDRGLLRVRVRDVTKPAVEPKKITVRESNGGQRKTVEGGK